MDHYLVVFTKDKCIEEKEQRKSLVAFNLLDHSVQEAEIGIDLSQDMNESVLKYGENQIVKYGFDLALITIESFERILLI